MRIANVYAAMSSRFGGPVSLVADASEELQRLGHEVTIFATNLGRIPGLREWRTIADEERVANADKLDIELYDVSWPQRLAYSPGLGRRLDEVVGSYDVVHVHSLWLYPQYAAQRAARKAGVPYVVSPHGALDPFMREHGRGRKWIASKTWQNGMLEHADCIHVTTEEEKGLLADIAPSRPRYVVPNGIVVDRFKNAEGDGVRFRKRFFDGFEGPLVLFLGRITYKKGVDVLVRSFAEVVNQVPGARLAVVGPDDENLTPGNEQLARSLGVADATVFTGALYGQDRADALAAADVWALPSHTENFGIAVVEACAAGLATVISPAVNIASQMQAAGAGLVASLSPVEFGSAVASVLIDEQLRSGLGEHAVEYADTLDWSVVAPDLVTMYQRCIDGTIAD